MVISSGDITRAKQREEKVTQYWKELWLLMLYVCLKGFLDSSVGKESTFHLGDTSSISVFGRSTGEGVGYPLQYSWAFLLAQLVKNMHVQYRRPGFGPRVGKIPWRRKRPPTPLFWPVESHGLYSPWRKEQDMTERLSLHYSGKRCCFSLVFTSFLPSFFPSFIPLSLVHIYIDI